MTKVKWIVNPARSNVNFSVKNMMIPMVYGAFHKFNASIEADPNDLTTANIQFNIDVASIKTHNIVRDAHLRSNFFNSEQFPTLTFKSTNIVKKDIDKYGVSGILTVHGTTRIEMFTVSIKGLGKDSSGNEKVGFSSKGKIYRSDYGLSWNAILDPFIFYVGDQINISIQIEASKVP